MRKRPVYDHNKSPAKEQKTSKKPARSALDVHAIYEVGQTRQLGEHTVTVALINRGYAFLKPVVDVCLSNGRRLDRCMVAWKVDMETGKVDFIGSKSRGFDFD
jgi:hypothetical protein